MASGFLWRKDRRCAGAIQFDPEKIKAAGHPLTTMLIVTGEGGAKNVTMHSGMEAKAGETAVITYE